MQQGFVFNVLTVLTQRWQSNFVIMHIKLQTNAENLLELIEVWSYFINHDIK